MSDKELPGLGLTEAVRALRSELLAAQQDPAVAGVRFPLESVSIELKVAATRSADGQAGFRIPIVDASLDGSVGWAKESMQTVTVTFGPPLDEQGHPIKIAAGTDLPKD